MPALLAVAWLFGAALGNAIELTPRDLFGGLEARKVVLEDSATRLALDPQVFQFGRNRQGVIVTDPIDLGAREGVLGITSDVKSVAVALSATMPLGATIVLESRSGNNRFGESGWSAWETHAGFEARVRPLVGRFLQLRITLQADRADRRPAVTGVTLRPVSDDAPAWPGKLTILKNQIPRLKRSPLPFHYERPDAPPLIRFRQAAKLDSIVAGASDDFEKLVRLMDWIGGGRNVRGQPWSQGKGDTPYPWDIDRLVELTPEGKLIVKGHCMSYAVALISAATALGYHARHWAIEGFRDMDHEVVEIWVPSRGKWIYFDPSLTTYYFDERTKEPLNVLELHRLVAARFVKSHEDMNWWHQENSAATRARVREVGGKAGVGCRLGPCSYGNPMPREYDWGWNHGYLACGFLQLTPRNDFHSHPEATAKDFAGARRFTADGYPFWVDEKTPPIKDETGQAINWYTRERDFYWTPDVATMDLIKGQEGVLRVEFGNSMPFFRRYRVKVDGAEAMDAVSPFLWKLRPGVNRLEVVPENWYGKMGAGASVEVEYARAIK